MDRLSWHLAGATLLLSALAASDPASAEGLRSVVQRTVSSNPEVAALRANRLAVDEELEAAKGLGRPKLDLRGAAGYSGKTIEGTGPSDYNSNGKHLEYGGVATMPVFDGWKTSYEIERQGARVDSARHRVADTASSLALQAVQAYLEVERAIAVEAAAKRNVATHRGLLSRVNARYAAGKVAKSDLTQVEARLAAAEAARVEAEGRRLDALSLYTAVVGEVPQKLETVGMPSRLLPRTAAQAVEIARRNAPSLLAVREDVLAARADIGSARSQFFPQIGLEFSAQEKRDADRHIGNVSDLSALVVVRQTLYDGGIARALVRENIHRADQAEAIAGNATRLIEKEVRLAWLAMQTSNQRAVHLGEQLTMNRQLVGEYTSEFELGQKSLLDVLDVENEIFVTESELTTESFAATYNAYRLLAAIGSLLPALEVALPEEATREADRSRFSLR